MLDETHTVLGGDLLAHLVRRHDRDLVGLDADVAQDERQDTLADAAEADFNNRAKGGIPDDIPELQLSGAPLGIAALLKAANLVPSSSEANRNIDQSGVRVDGTVISDKTLKLNAGTYVVQVGKRRFAKVTLTA